MKKKKTESTLLGFLEEIFVHCYSSLKNNTFLSPFISFGFITGVYFFTFFSTAVKAGPGVAT
jgi:hypothetical protein